MTTADVALALTIDERDAIDMAKGRLRRLAALVSTVLNVETSTMTMMRLTRRWRTSSTSYARTWQPSTL